MMSSPSGLCQCGCGCVTTTTDRSSRALGLVKGRPRRFISGHHKRGPLHHGWKGGVHVGSKGYVEERAPGHPRANRFQKVKQHILVAEKALGKYIPVGVEVHHWNRIRSDNRPENLLICQDGIYHGLIHQRQKAFETCGHADWLKCVYCKIYSSPDTLRISRLKNGIRGMHAECNRLQSMKQRARDKQKASIGD